MLGLPFIGVLVVGVLVDGNPVTEKVFKGKDGDNGRVESPNWPYPYNVDGSIHTWLFVNENPDGFVILNFKTLDLNDNSILRVYDGRDTKEKVVYVLQSADDLPLLRTDGGVPIYKGIHSSGPALFVTLKTGSYDARKRLFKGFDIQYTFDHGTKPTDAVPVQSNSCVKLNNRCDTGCDSIYKPEECGEYDEDTNTVLIGIGKCYQHENDACDGFDDCGNDMDENSYCTSSMPIGSILGLSAGVLTILIVIIGCCSENRVRSRILEASPKCCQQCCGTMMSYQDRLSGSIRRDRGQRSVGQNVPVIAVSTEGEEGNQQNNRITNRTPPPPYEDGEKQNQANQQKDAMLPGYQGSSEPLALARTPPPTYDCALEDENSVDDDLESNDGRLRRERSLRANEERDPAFRINSHPGTDYDHIDTSVLWWR